MSLKKFFKPQAQTALRSSKINVNISGSDVLNTLDDLKQKSDFDQKIFAFADVSSSLDNYVRYGLAEYHFETGIQRIYNDYPYDGTEGDKYKFFNESNTFDYYIYKDLYPKTTGFITINETKNLLQRVEVKAGPNLNNVYLSSSQQTNNLHFDANQGATVEFWAKPSGDAMAGGIFETVDTNGNFFCVFLNNPGGTGVQLIVQKSSSAGGVEANTTFTTLTGFDAAFHHYALTFELNASDKLISTLYVDGVFTEQLTDSATVSTVVNAVSGNVGFAQTYSFTGSIDEFRYWKTRRTTKEIGVNYNSQVYGGSNVTGSTSYPLGLYLKFNEGITATASIDQSVLDYSGRVASASILNYTAAVRSTGSAIEQFNPLFSENPDPIIYATHPDVKSLEANKVRDGRIFDRNNYHSFYQLMPEHVRGSDDTNDLKFLSHIIGARFDELYAQISSFEKVKRKDYQDQDLKIFPYYEKLLEGSGFTAAGFLDGDLLTEVQEKTTAGNLVSGSLNDLKNYVYRNIYNNLLHIYKTKGTQKSIRNLLHCYGVDDNLIRLRNFASNTTTTIENRDEVAQFKDKTIDFYGIKNLVAEKTLPNEASIFNYTGSDANNKSFVTGGFSAFSIENNVYFPRQEDSDSDFFISFDTSGSIFGVHAADPDDSANTTFKGNDVCGLAAYAVHSGKTNRQGKFVLSSSNGNFTAIETSIYDIFDSTNWNLAVVVEPDGDPRNVLPAKSLPYIARFIGYQVESGQTVNSFNLTSSISAAAGANMIAESKRVFVGAQRTNFTGSILHRSYARIGNCKFFGDSLEEDEVFLHAKYRNSDGRQRPFENINRKNRDTITYVPGFLSKVFEWDFDQVTTPDSVGQFSVVDTTSASIGLTSSFGIYGPVVSKTYTGYGFQFPTDIKVFENEFVSKVRSVAPEEATAANVINAQGESVITFQPNEAATSEAVIFGKSMYDVISGDMLKAFAGIKDFNHLIGTPVNRYRMNYKELDHLRRLYFDSVERNPELEKFTKYFKWLDTVVDTVIDNLIPATTNIASHSPNVVESHALERSKYPMKYPTLEFKDPRPSGTISQIVSLQNISRRLNLIDDRRTGAANSFNFASSSAKVPNNKRVEEIGAQSIVSGAITPVVIANTPFLTGNEDDRRVGAVTSFNFASGTMGNFKDDYEVVQAVGQKGAFNGRYLAIEGDPGDTVSPGLSDTHDFSRPARNKFKTVIRSTFNAPGSPETMHGGLDVAAREFSVYNNMNYRNSVVRNAFNTFLKTPSAFGGFQSGSTVTGSFHKIHRNGYDKQFIGATKLQSKKIFDNGFVQTQLPATDLQYLWITSSFQNTNIRRYQTQSAHLPNEQITFISGALRGVSENEEINFVYFTTPPSKIAEFTQYHYELNTTANLIQAPLAMVNGTEAATSIYFLNINGPYQAPSWKMYRKDDHPVVRLHRQNNVVSFMTDSKLNVRGETLNFHVLNNVTQSAVSTTDPLFIRLQASDFVLKSSYENKKLGFTQEALQKDQQAFEASLDNQKTFLDKVLDAEKSEPQVFVDSLTLRSSIFPLKDNQFLQNTRARDVFDNKWWRTKRGDRTLVMTENVFGFTFSAFAGKPQEARQSRWSMDARNDFTTTSPEKDSRNPGGAGEEYGPDNPSGSGILQNSYTTFHLFPDQDAGSNLKYGPLYNRRTIEFTTTGTASPFASVIATSVTGGIINTGEALWEVGDQSGREPFYNSYDAYADELRRRGKDHSIVPEFKISDHIETYLTNGFDFATQLTDFVSLTGTSDFSVNRYSAAELSEVVAGLKEDTGLGISKFGLKAKALLKLLPYEGFYPQQRTVQLAEELSQSYADSIEAFDNNGFGFKNPRQYFFEPYVTPGILFNTIKSGLAVDYPMFEVTASNTFFQKGVCNAFSASVTYFGDAITNEWIATTLTATVSTDLGDMVATPFSSSIPFVNKFLGIHQNFTDAPFTLGIFNYGGGLVRRVPFEAMLDPFGNFKQKYIQFDANNLANNTGSFSIVGSKPKINHELFANNFFAETVNFFLKRGLVSFESLAKDVFAFDKTKTYQMDLTLTNADVSSVSEYSEKIKKQLPLITGPRPLEEVFIGSTASLEPTKNCVMYDRPDAFGFPSISDASESAGTRVNTRKFSAFTPPYYNGFARARYTFTPTQETHTLDEVVSSMKITYLRANENPFNILNADESFVAESETVVNLIQPDDEMQISASFVTDAVVEEKKTKFNEDGDIVEFESFDTPRKKLVIHSKYECPVLNFKNVSITRPASGSNTAPKGMWHQYGEIPDYSSTGIFAEISDGFVQASDRGFATASLADSLGIPKEKKAIGRLATARDVKEGLVVLPYYVDNTKDQPVRFFELTDDAVRKTLKKTNRRSVSSADDQLVRQARLMKDYVFPPFLDWVTFSPPDLTEASIQTNVKKPIMYVFEFRRTLSQTDLSNIWQGVLPDAGLVAVEQESVIDLPTGYESLVGTDGTPVDVINANIKSLIASGAPSIFEGDVKALNAIELDDLKFFVFKVKKRGEFQYSQITKNVEDDQFQFDFKPFGVQSELPFFEDFGKKRLAYSYNYPYDFFSLIELAKVDSSVELSGKIANIAPTTPPEPPAFANQTVTEPQTEEEQQAEAALSLGIQANVSSLTTIDLSALSANTPDESEDGGRNNR
tara:strand:+ start:6173 stop:14116 length:7944 start_codon:yes stop_codon:yes gene_type:complete